MPGNVVGKADRRGDLYPTKSRPDQKIDAAVALMMAIGPAMIEDEEAKGLEAFLTNPTFGRLGSTETKTCTPTFRSAHEIDTAFCTHALAQTRLSG